MGKSEVVCSAGDEARGRQRHGGLTAQRQQFLRHIDRGRIGVAPGGLAQLVAWVDPSIERLAHLPRAQGRVVLALAHLDADLFGADRGRAAIGQRLEGGAARGVGIGASVDLAVDPGLVEPGDAGDGTDLGIGRGAGDCIVPFGNGARAALHIVGSSNDIAVALSSVVGCNSACRIGHLCLHSNVGTGVGGRRHQGNLVGRPAHCYQHARAVLGGLGPVLDRIADRDMAQDARQNVLPDRLNLRSGRELDERRAPLAVHGGVSDGTQHIPDGGLAMCVKHAGALEARQVHGFWREAELLDILSNHVAAAHGRAGGPDHLDGAGLGIGRGGGQRRAAGEQFHGVSHPGPPSVTAPPTGRGRGPAHLRAPCRRQSLHRPVRRHSHARRSPGTGS